MTIRRWGLTALGFAALLSLNASARAEMRSVNLTVQGMT